MTILGVETAAPFVHYMKVLKWRTYQVRQVETAQGAETARNICTMNIHLLCMWSHQETSICHWSMHYEHIFVVYGVLAEAW